MSLLTMSGSVHAQSAVQFQSAISIDTQYDSNVEQTSGERDANVVTRIGPSLQLIGNQQAVDWSLSGRAGAALYYGESERNSISYGASLRAAGPKGGNQSPRYSFVDTLHIAPELDPDNDLETQNQIGNGILIRRLDTVQNSARIQMSVPVTERMGFSAGYGNSVTIFTQDPDTNVVDTISHSASGGVSYLLTRVDTLSLGYQYRLFQFDGGSSGHAHSLRVGESHQFSRTSSGSIGVGGTVVIQGERLNRAALADLGYSIKLSEKLSGSLGAGTDINTTSGLTDQIIRSRFVRGGISYQLTQRLSLSGSLRAFQNLRLRNSDDSTTDATRVISVSGGGGVSYQLATWASCRLSVSQSRQDVRSFDSAEEFVRTQITAGVVISF